MVADLGKTDSFNNATPGSEGIFPFFSFSGQTRPVFLNKLIIDGSSLPFCNPCQRIEGFLGFIHVKKRPDIRFHTQKFVPEMPGGWCKHLPSIGYEQGHDPVTIPFHCCDSDPPERP